MFSHLIFFIITTFILQINIFDRYHQTIIGHQQQVSCLVSLLKAYVYKYCPENRITRNVFY